MRKIFLFGLVALLFVACQNPPKNYFDASPEIETVKSGIAYYEAQDWTNWKSNFADTAKIYHNTNKGSTPDETISYLKEMLSNIDSYGFNKEGVECEMVIDPKGRTWVNYWNNWKGITKVTNKEINLPVHLTLQFVDGKIVQEFAYYDTAPIKEAFAEIEAYNAMSSDEKTLTNTINTMVDVWNKNDQDAMKSITVPNLVRNSNGTREVNNQEEYGAMMTSFFTGFPDFKVILENSEIKDNKAIITWRCVGTNTGEFLGNAPTNKKINVLGMSIWTFNSEGKATQEDAFFDNLNMFNQLGITPPKA